MKTSQKVREIIEKWYHELQFPSKYDAEFYEALDTIYVSEYSNYAKYDVNDEDGKKNFLHYLYFCEDLKKRYMAKGIPLTYLYDNLEDMPVWLDTWSDIKGELYLGELGWFRCIFRMALYKVGRLQFKIGESYKEVPEVNLHKGDNVLDIHIPARGALSEEECLASLRKAGKFFATYFPEFSYEHMMCYSWLLGDNLEGMLKPDSNILKFKALFDVHSQKESDGIISFAIGWKKTREDVKKMEFSSRFQNEIKSRVLAGEPFYAGFGTIKKSIL
ncbi:MAG: hypothetical protein IKL80_05200 [Clostridia bacterium]|nr:hypothetical protein [Clostridia bacterium]